MKKLEFHAALFQRLIDRREYGVPHPALHFPEHRAARTQQQSEKHADRHTRRQRWLVGIAIDKRKNITVGRIDGRIRKTVVARAVATQPFAQIEMIDDIEAVLDNAVFQHADHHRNKEIAEQKETQLVGILSDEFVGLAMKPPQQALEPLGKLCIGFVGVMMRFLFFRRLGKVVVRPRILERPEHTHCDQRNQPQLKPPLDALPEIFRLGAIGN